MVIPLAHYKSESYRDVNIANNRKIIGNVRTIFGNHRVIALGLVSQTIDIRIFYESRVWEKHQKLDIEASNFGGVRTVPRDIMTKRGQLVWKRINSGWCVNCATTIPHSGIGGDRTRTLCPHKK